MFHTGINLNFEHHPRWKLPKGNMSNFIKLYSLSHEDVGYNGVNVYILKMYMCDHKLQYDSIWYGAFGRWLGLEEVVGVGLMIAWLLFSH